VPEACSTLEPYLLSQMVGQELAIQQFSDAVCDHVQKEHPLKPLVVSAHGPPGVGKSMSHLLAARALYSHHPNSVTSCPGIECAGYKASSFFWGEGG
jgi:replication-associated recombination protein RarA